ncbi:MAG: hypothetical protein M1839_002770 [Geoglossum umbratile]|nr:MAG: hypothetical protein M1839_002770 [Geoglossum umbratile]
MSKLSRGINRLKAHFTKPGNPSLVPAYPQPTQAETAAAPQSSSDANAREQIVETERSRAWIGKYTVSLPQIFQPQHPNLRVAAAQQALQFATEELQAALEKKAPGFRDFATVDDKSVREALLKAQKQSLRPGELFGALTEQLLSDDEEQRETLSGKIGDFMSKLYPVVNLVLGVMTATSDVAGFSPAKSAANGVNQILALAMDERSRSDDIVELLGKLPDYQENVDRLRTFSPDILGDSVLEKATYLLAAITDFLRISLVYLKSHYIKNLVENLADSPVTEGKRSLENALREFDSAVDRQINSIILNQQQERERKETLEWLSKENFKNSQDDVRHRRLENTGQWLLVNSDFQQWMNGNLPILWCEGFAGAGKTCITSIVVDHVTETFRSGNQKSGAEIGVTFLYCKSPRPAHQTVLGFILSVARQLLEQGEHNSPLLIRAKEFKKEHSEKGKPANLEECSVFLSEILDSFSRVYLMVDALDEFATSLQERAELMKTLLELTPRDKGTLRLFITSRPAKEIRGKLGIHSTVDIRASDLDMQSYINHRIARNENVAGWVKQHPHLKENIVTAVMEKSRNTFRLVELQMDRLLRQPSAGRIAKAIGTLTSEVEDYYADLVARIKESGRENATIVIRMLSWLVYAKRDLEVSEVKHALAVDPGNYSAEEYELFLEFDLGGYVDQAAGLVAIAGQSNTMILAHVTVREYLEKRTDVLPDPEVDLAQTCLTYLSLDVFADASKSNESRPKRYPFLRYSAENWGYHLQGEPEQRLQPLVVDFLGKSRNISNFLHFHPYFPDSMSPIHITAAFGLEKITRLLLEHKVDVEADITGATSDGETALHWAASSGDQAVIELLLDKGADIAAKDSDGETALHWAASGGYEAVVEVMVEKGADIAAKDNYGWTALSRATDNGHKTTVELLLRMGADAMATTNDGWTPLQRAASGGHEAVVELLVEKGANVAAEDNYGWTALNRAASSGHKAVVRLLLEKGADVSVATNYGWTPLHSAATSGHRAVVELLLEKGADIAAKDKHKWTALYRAASGGHKAIVELLLEKGADVEAKDSYGWTALHSAATCGQEAVVELLLERGADTAATTNHGWTALHSAGDGGSKGTVELLLKNGAAIGATNADGETPLHCAAKSGRVGAVELLVEEGADITATTNSGETALQSAAKRGHQAVVELLEATNRSQ